MDSNSALSVESEFVEATARSYNIHFKKIILSQITYFQMEQKYNF